MNNGKNRVVMTINSAMKNFIFDTKTFGLNLGSWGKLIKTAKKTYYHKKFQNVQGDVKKTWKLINDLRGKAKTNIKASFIINGEIRNGTR